MKALLDAATALGVDLSYADLGGLHLSGERLAGGKFNGASFDRTNLVAAGGGIALILDILYYDERPSKR